jgi:phosphoribosylanthranilate isomerase
MPVKAKICGLNSDVALAAALDGGADFVGFVFYPPSPRSLSPQAAGTLARAARGRAEIVALFVDPDDTLLADVMRELDPDIIQLHGKETPERVAEIKARWGRPVMKAVSIATRADADAALKYEGIADLFLFDAKAPPDLANALPGGNGITFDWRALEGVKGRVRFMLSGGLNADNVAEAIRLTGAEIVDVSSGVERRPGEKDPELIRKFLAAAKLDKAAPVTAEPSKRSA